MLAGKKVYRSDYPDTVFRYDESKEKNGEQAIRVIHKGKELGGTLAFFFLPNLGWKEYHPEE